MLPINLLLQNRYRLIRLIGQGGMGAVYEAVDQRLGHTVAIKQILRGDAHAFEREARLLARLSHPALPKVSDHFAEEAGQFLVMEFIPGDDLAKSLLRQEAAFSVEKVLTWGDQLLDVLVYLHSQTPPVLHRDIKPANVKLTNQGQIVLLDFGLAKGKTGETSAAQKSAAGYTLCYAAPEQIRNEGTDVRSDLYSVAATLYHLLTGSKPPDAIQRALTLADSKPDPLLARQPVHATLPTTLWAVLLKAMALNPADRFGSASALRRALQVTSQEQTVAVLQTELPRQAVKERSSLSITHNLPTQLTALIGREQEIATLQAWLARADIRLITLTGAGGSGKTRLALAVAQTIVDKLSNPQAPNSDDILPTFQCVDGVFFVNLAPIRDAELLISTIAQTLGVKETSGEPLIESLQADLRDKSLLLVLDNFEQIILAAPLVSDLLAACPLLKIIVTSREVLRVRGEREFLVPVLAVPNPTQPLTAEALAHYTAVELFVQRAQTVKPSFLLDETNAQTVAQICAQLDGLPLAIELAAARSKLLTPQAILARLNDRFKFLNSGARDLPDRQRTLQSAIDWSYELLSEDEKTLFCRLAVFVGGRTLEAIEAVCNPADDKNVPILQIDVIDGLTSLIDKCLIYQITETDGEQRFMLLVTLHDYAKDRLADSPEAQAMHRRHANYYLTLAEEAEIQLVGSEVEVWLSSLELEHDNFRAALMWYTEVADYEKGLRLSAALYRFWLMRNHKSEGCRWLETLLAADNISEEVRAKALWAFGYILHFQGNDNQRAKLFFDESLALYRRVGHKHGIARALAGLGLETQAEGNYPLAFTFFAEALRLHRELDDQYYMAVMLNNLGTVAEAEENLNQAALFYNESLIVFEGLKNKFGIALVLNNLGQLTKEQGEFEKAASLYRRCLIMRVELGDKQRIVETITGLAGLANAQRLDIRGAQLLGAANAICQHYNVNIVPSDRLSYERSMTAIQAALGEVAFAQAWAIGQAMSLEQAIQYALQSDS